MKYPNPNMLLRIAQGDAYCMATEFIKFPEQENLKQEALKFGRYLKHPTHTLGAGRYTDDTQMSVAVAEVLLGDYGNISRESFAEAFVRTFHQDPRDGYSRNFQVFLEKTHSGEEFLKNIKPDSDKNGAAMRSVPIGVLSDPRKVKQVAELQARLTHDTPGGILSSQLVAMMSHFALYGSWEFEDLKDWLELQFKGYEIEGWEGGPVKGPGLGMATAKAVLTLLTEETSLLGILKRTIEWGGDTDSVAAIAFGIASCRMKEELPDFFEYGLETGRCFGTHFLRQVGKDLMDAYNTAPNKEKEK